MFITKTSLRNMLCVVKIIAMVERSEMSRLVDCFIIEDVYR